LFRQQALEHVAVRQYGTVILTRPVSYWFLTAMFVGFALLVLVFFFCFSTTRKAQCQGILLPSSGVIRIFPSQPGVVTEKRVREGQRVAAGDILFILSGERSGANVDSVQNTVSALMRSRRDSFGEELKQADLQSREHMAALLRKIDQWKADIGRADDQIELQKNRIAVSEKAYKRFSDLKDTNFISSAQLQDKQIDLLDQQQKMVDLQRGKAGSERELAAAESDYRDLQIQAQREAAALRRNVSSTEQDLTENEATRKITVRAPQSGVVTAIAFDVGQSATKSTPMVSLLPSDARLEAEIYVPSRSIGFVQPGMAVQLRYEAYPYQKFGQYTAHVYEISNTSVRADELSFPSSAPITNGASEPVYRIRLKLDQQTVQAYGKPVALKSGMLVDASILLEHRYLYEWILEPLFSVSGKI
jgi:membrane fusion protein